MKNVFKVGAFLLVVFQIFVFAGCGSSKSSNSGSGTAIYKSVEQTDGLNTTANFDKTASQAAPSNQASQPNTADSRKIIMSAEMSLQTTTYDKSITDVEGLVRQYGGFIQDSTTQGTGATGNERSASFAIRVPFDKFDEFLNSVGSVGKIVSKNKKGQDVTQGYFDTESRLKTLRSEQDRILAILSKTTTMADILTIENKLADLENQIESLTGTIQKYDGLVNLSTVTISIKEVKEITATPANNFGGQIADVFKGSLKTLGATLQVIFIVIVAIMPFVVFFGLIIVILLIIVRRKKKRKEK